MHPAGQGSAAAGARTIRWESAMSRPRVVHVFFPSLLVCMVAFVHAQTADIAERAAINPGLGPCPSQVLRDTPAEAWHSFMQLGTAGDFALAAHLLDLTEVPVDAQSGVGARVAERLYSVLITLGAS